MGSRARETRGARHHPRAALSSRARGTGPSAGAGNLRRGPPRAHGGAHARAGRQARARRRLLPVDGAAVPRPDDPVPGGGLDRASREGAPPAARLPAPAGRAFLGCRADRGHRGAPRGGRRRSASTPPAKTVADCFKYRNKVGIDVAVEALRDFSRKHRGGATDLARFARICRVSRVMQPYLDAIA